MALQLIKVFPSHISAELVYALYLASVLLDIQCKPQIPKETSHHIGFWRRYFHELFLSRDTRAGAIQFTKHPEVQEFFRVIDRLFMLIDRDLCQLYRAVTPPEQRICGSSFLMAVVNHGGTGPHADWMDFKEGCCCVAPFGLDWSGGELAFRHLGLAFDLQPGDVIFFRSARLIHENLPHSGDRRSIVLTSDENAFTGNGQPLEPTAVKLMEEYLQAIRDRYEKWTKEQCKIELHRRLNEREQNRREHCERERQMREQFNIGCDTKQDLSDRQVLREKLQTKQILPLQVKVKREPPKAKPKEQITMEFLVKRFNAGKQPLRAKRSRRQNPTRAKRATVTPAKGAQRLSTRSRRQKKTL